MRKIEIFHRIKIVENLMGNILVYVHFPDSSNPFQDIAVFSSKNTKKRIYIYMFNNLPPCFECTGEDIC